MMSNDEPQSLTLLEAIVPVASLIVLIALSYYLFGDAGASGPNQVALVVATMIAVAIAWRRGYTLDALREGADSQCQLRHERDLHLVRRRRADRHLGHERNPAGDDLLRSSNAQSRTSST